VTPDGAAPEPRLEDLKVPPVVAGLRVGLFGGSFDPPHQGHLHVVETALERLRLDRVWMMVTPGNPLKNRAGLPPLGARIDAARALVRHPRVVVTGLEAGFGSPFSWETVRRLTACLPAVRFVWIMGADNLGAFHRWQHWRRIADAVPIAIVDRPGHTLAALSSPAARALAGRRIPEHEAASILDAPPPVWTFLHAPRSPLSSTALRRAGVR
jgi:nicotinate-nucleotide adenylyltransferase